MWKQLSLALALVVATACKTDAPAPASAAPSGEAPSTKVRSAKIDLPPARPVLPAAGSDDQPAAPEPDPQQGWHKRRDAMQDGDGSGSASDDKRAAAMYQRLVNMRARLDVNGDGKLTPDELASARGRLRDRFDNPEALDTNHDGDISADELAAAVKARRDQRRAARGSGDSAEP